MSKTANCTLEVVTTKKKATLNIYIQRARYEMSVIDKMGFDGYFLIVREAINWCKENGINIVMGSVACSICKKAVIDVTFKML